jgi:luciferase family oxidoreductase group 1
LDLDVLAISILDQSPIPAGGDARGALANTLDLAELAERRGFERYWVAEHHGTTGLAGSAPEILVAYLAARTRELRVGTGGIMLPHYSAYKIAEQFRVLANLAPGRIDLGLGRAPGGSPLSTLALRRQRDRPTPDDFDDQVAEVIAWLDGDIDTGHPFAPLAQPGLEGAEPEPWLLSSSGYGAGLAASLGAAFCFAHFISPTGGAEAISRYRTRYVATPRRPHPHAAVAAAAICAPTREEAIDLAKPVTLWRQRLRQRGDPGPVPTLAEARSELGGSDRLPATELSGQRMIVGEPHHVGDELRALADELGVEEIVVVTITHDHAARRRSYELIADELGVVPRSTRAQAVEVPTT